MIATPPRCSAGLPSRSPAGLHQVEDIRAYLGRVMIPFVQPMAVDFPARAGQSKPLTCTPLMNCLMGLSELAVGTKVSCRHDGAGRGGRTNDFAVRGKGRVQFDAHFEVDHIVPIESDVP